MGICCSLLDPQTNSNGPVMLWGRRTSLVWTIFVGRMMGLSRARGHWNLQCKWGLPPVRKVREGMVRPCRKATPRWGWISPIIGIRNCLGEGP
jgi:hypothetical protein